MTEADLAFRKQSGNSSQQISESWIHWRRRRSRYFSSVIALIVDPLDGTSNYVHGFPAYCVSVALAYDDEVLAGAIYDPVADECFTAVLGGGARLENTVLQTTDPSELSEALVAVSFPPHVDRESIAVADFLSIVPHVHSVRRTGSTAINLAHLAAGRLDGFWVRRIACWDVAAGLLIALEAGRSYALSTSRRFL